MPGRAQTAARLEDASDLISPDALWRFTVDQYHSMTRGGILDEDDLVELLHGWLIAKMPKSPQHRLATQLLRDALAWVAPASTTRATSASAKFLPQKHPLTLEKTQKKFLATPSPPGCIALSAGGTLTTTGATFNPPFQSSCP